MLRRSWEVWTGYWFKPTALLDLAATRVIIVVVQLYTLLPASADLRKLREHSALPDELYDPLPILHLMVAPIGWTYRPGFEVLEVVYWLTLAMGVTAMLGLLTNVSLLLFAAGNVFLRAFQYSFGEFHHPEGPMMVALVVLALSPSGRALSVDAWWAKRGGKQDQRVSRFARWPLLVIQWMLVMVYLSAAYHKLKVAGLDWMNGYTLQFYILRDALRWDVPLGLWLGQHHWLILGMSVVTLVWEATFFLVLILPALALIYVPLGLGFHAGTWLTMNVRFVAFLGLYAAFVPWAEVYRWIARQGGHFRR
ncbi:MAG: hypothetical protein KJO65_08030 [Gemmatimonadetes bacterium]|nr:hypothetical protein [Gemmatimonadota bacterium]